MLYSSRNSKSLKDAPAALVTPFVLCIVLISSAMAGSAMAASTAIVTATADVFVFEANPKHNANEIALLQAGIGRVAEVGNVISYLRFDLSEIPSSTLFTETRVTRATLRLLAQSFGLADSDARFFVSVAPCPEVGWAEDGMTWETRACKDLSEPDDMIVVEGARLPTLYNWDVARSIAAATLHRRRKISFVISAFKLEVQAGAREIVPGRDFGPNETVGFVRFWSRERAVLSASAAPTLTVTYETMDTSLVQFGQLILAILSALSVAFGVWEGLRKLGLGRSRSQVQ